jgi:hypothetical protein
MTFNSYDELMLSLDSQTSDEDRRRERIRTESIKDLIKNVIEPTKTRAEDKILNQPIQDELLNKIIKGGKKK